MRAEVVSRCGLSSSLKERHLFLFLNPTTLLNSSCRGLNSFAVSLSLSLSSLSQSIVRSPLFKAAAQSPEEIRRQDLLQRAKEHAPNSRPWRTFGRRRTPPSSAPLRTARSTAMIGRQGNCTSHQGPKPDPRKARTSRVCVEDLCFEDPYFPSKRSLQPCRLTALKQHQRSRPGWPLSYPVASPPAKVEKTLVPADEPVTTRVPPTLPQANFAPSRNVATPSAVRAKDICRL
jgi:hypothetical protein